jgi:histidyl-tRNA synthetase
MATKFQAVKGTADFYPAEKEQLKKVACSLKKTAKSYGFSEVETPAIETLKLLTAKSGEEIKQQIFVFEKKGEKKEAEELGLRFDLTVPITRLFVERQKELAKPVKWFAFDKMWRYEAPQKGRDREFYQLSVELFGSGMPEADAEIISMCADCMRNLGLKARDFVIKVNNRKLLSGILADILPRAKDGISETLKIIDKARKITEDELDDLLAAEKLNSIAREKIKDLVKIKGKPGAVIAKLKKMKLNAEAMCGLAELENISQYLDSDVVELDLSVARGLVYYTGTVFECYDRDENLRAIAGGGRYDDMVELFGGDRCEAVGFAIGYSTLKLLLEAKGLLPKPDAGVDFYIAPVNAKMAKKARSIAEDLRKKGFSAETDLMSRKLGKQLEFASTIGAKKVVIVGPEELKQKKVVVRDMKSGKEEKIAPDKL